MPHHHHRHRGLRHGRRLRRARRRARPRLRATPCTSTSTYAGGEPVMFTDNVHHTIIYSSARGHDAPLPARAGLSLDDVRVRDRYRNQVNLWTSSDDGRRGSASTAVGGLAQPPAAEHRLLRPRPHPGRRRPDLQHRHQPRQRRAVLAHATAGKTWDQGTAQLPRRRPAVAGRRQDRTRCSWRRTRSRARSAHQVFRSTDGGNTCWPTGIPDAGDARRRARTWTATASCYYDAHARRARGAGEHQNADGHAPALGVEHAGTAATPRSRRTRPSTRRLYAHWADDRARRRRRPVPRLGQRPAARPARAAAATAPRRPRPTRSRMVLLQGLRADAGHAPLTIARRRARARVLAVGRRRATRARSRRLVPDRTRSPTSPASRRSCA